MKKLLLLFIPALFLSSCAKEAKFRNVEIHLNDWTSEVEFTDIFKETDRIQLDNNPECYIHDRSIVKLVGDRFYIYDPKSDHQQVLVFDKEGNLINRIGICGQGPGEYNTAYTFAVNEKKDQLVILAQPSTFYVYDLNSGEFLFSKKTDPGMYCFDRFSDCYLATTSPGISIREEATYLFYKLDDDFNIVDAKFKPAQDQNCDAQTLGLSPLHKVGDDAIYLNEIPSVVYQYDCNTDTAGLLYKFIYPKQMPPEIYTDFSAMFQNFANYKLLKHFAVNSEAMLVSYLGDPSGTYTVELDRNGNLLHKVNFSDDIPPTSIFVTDDTFMSLYDAGTDDNLAIIIYEKIKL